MTRLSQSDLPGVLGRAVPLVTADAAGRPHPMLCSYLELLAMDPAIVRLAIGKDSRSARNLDERGAATLLVIDAERTVYVKCRAGRRRFTMGSLARFDLAVEEVLEDSPADWETGIRITGGIGYAPVPALDAPWVQDTLAALRAERA